MTMRATAGESRISARNWKTAARTNAGTWVSG